jgi:hypothetical protein
MKSSMGIAAVIAFLSCGVSSIVGCGSDSGSNAARPSEAANGAASSAVAFDVDTAAHKTGTVEGKDASVAFDFTQDGKNFALHVTTVGGEPLVDLAVSPDHYVRRIFGNGLEVEWTRAASGAVANVASPAAAARHASGDESLAGKLAARPEFPLLSVLQKALQPSLNKSAASASSARKTAAGVQGVVLLPPEGGDKGPVCIPECLDKGYTRDQCTRMCLGDSYPGCTPEDNTANHDACVAGIDAWEVACELDPINIFTDYCSSVADESRDACPPATTCT